MVPGVYARDPLGLPATVALIVDALAVFRLVRLAIADRILDRPRRALTRRSDRRRGVFSYFITCPWCTSIWLAAGVVAARLLVPDVWAPIGVGLALSAAAAVLMGQVGA
jgi:hypothetical protein